MTMSVSEIAINDLVRTKNLMLFVEAKNPTSGEEIETIFPKWYRLNVCDVHHQENTVDVELPDGYIATLSMDDVEL